MFVAINYAPLSNNIEGGRSTNNTGENLRKLREANKIMHEVLFFFPSFGFDGLLNLTEMFSAKSFHLLPN